MIDLTPPAASIISGPFAVNPNTFIHPSLHRVDSTEAALIVRMASLRELARIVFVICGAIFAVVLLVGCALVFPSGVDAVGRALPLIAASAGGVALIALVCATVAFFAGGWRPDRVLLVISRWPEGATPAPLRIARDRVRGVHLGKVVIQQAAPNVVGDHSQIIMTFADGEGAEHHLLVAAHSSGRAMLRLASSIAEWCGVPLTHADGWRIGLPGFFAGRSAWGGAVRSAFDAPRSDRDSESKPSHASL